MTNHRRAPKKIDVFTPVDLKVCPKDGAQYQDFCMDYGCENQDGSGGCKGVQAHECASAIAHKCNTAKTLCKIWCDHKCEKCPIAIKEQKPQ